MTLNNQATFPVMRMRRLRMSGSLRALVRETVLTPNDLVWPLFVRHGRGIRRPIASMPGQFQLSVDRLVEHVAPFVELGLQSVMLFGIPAAKDPIGEENFADEGIVQQAVRALKQGFPQLAVMTDVCMCEYTDHGHCGVLHDWPADHAEAIRGHPVPQGYVLNDESIQILGQVCVSHAQAGADVVAPSAMMDGQVKAIRQALDEAGYAHLPIMAYSAKFASAFYGPFRDAAESPPSFGDRSQYQMDPGNRREALRESALDAQEGADILMVKPALPYLDIIRDTRNEFSHPLAAYNVSGEYAMIKAAAEKGWIDERRVALEALLSIKRAGADIILTYYTPEVLGWLRGEG
ncbi:MAG: porphobilinogen synthase [Ardenticatenaceae bacterium]